MHKKLFNYI